MATPRIGGPRLGEYARSRPFAIVSPGFEQRVDRGGSLDHLHRCRTSPPAPYAAIELGVEAADATVSLGLTAHDGDGVLVEYDPRRRRARIVVIVDGVRHRLRSRRIGGATLHRLAFVVCENQVTAVVDSGRGWRSIATSRVEVSRLVDLRDPEVLGRLNYTWGTSGPGSVTVRDVRAGPFGMTGLRDPHLVQYADGTPYVRDGRTYVTMTCAGMGFFQQAHWGVFALDLDGPDELTQVAHLYTRRDGLLLGDHAGQIVIDGDRCIVVASSWGDFTPQRGVHVRHAVTGLDILSGVHVLETDRLALPTEQSAWDPALTRIADRWHIAYVESPSQEPFRFHPALAASPAGGAYDDLAAIGADTDHEQCEGPVIAQLDGEWRVLASDGHARDYPVYDLDLKRIGSLDATYGTNIPHPQLIPADEEGTERMLTFDGTPWGNRILGYGTHGDLVLMRRLGRRAQPRNPSSFSLNNSGSSLNGA